MSHVNEGGRGSSQSRDVGLTQAVSTSDCLVLLSGWTFLPSTSGR